MNEGNYVPSVNPHRVGFGLGPDPNYFVDNVQEKLREVYTPKDGRVLVEPDFSQTEVQLTENDKPLIESPLSQAEAETLAAFDSTAVETAVVDVENIAHVLHDFADSLDLVLAVALSKMPINTTKTKNVHKASPPVWNLEHAVLSLLKKTPNRFVSRAKLGFDASSIVSKLRKRGYDIIGAQTARNNGEPIKKGLTGYRLNTLNQETLTNIKDICNHVRKEA